MHFPWLLCPSKCVLIPMAFDVTYLTWGVWIPMDGIYWIHDDSRRMTMKNAKFLGFLEFKKTHPTKKPYKSGKTWFNLFRMQWIFKPLILRHWNALFQLLPYRCQWPGLWDTLSSKPCTPHPPSGACLSCTQKFDTPWIRLTQIDIQHRKSWKVPRFQSSPFHHQLPPKHNLSSFFKRLGDCCL